MTLPTLRTSDQPILAIDGDVLVLGVTSSTSGPALVVSESGADHAGLSELEQSLTTIGFSGARDEIRRLPSNSGATRSIAVVGLGSGPVTPSALRYAAGSAARQLLGVESLVLALPVTTDEDLTAVLEGAALGAYQYTRYRISSVDRAKSPATTITVATTRKAASALNRANAVAGAVHTVRDLVNAPPNDLYPQSFADSVLALATQPGVTVKVLAEEELTAGGFGGLLGVGQGSTRGPRLVKVVWSPDDANRHLALVGKGITFDSGGLSLKPPTSMIGMKYDMTGAATVLAVLLAVAELQLPVHVTAWLCLAENMPSGAAMRPGDVITIRNGSTVEVLNTDAEGRLVLADGLSAASEEHPDAIIDVATLTGAASVALGTRYVGVMGDADLVTRVVAAGDRVDETLWPMPIASELRPLLASDVADIANIKPGNTAGGMMLAAAFLRDFIGQTGEGDTCITIPWAHLDIAGPADNKAAGWGYTGKGPTGISVRTLIELAEEYSRP